jgi:CheY-like chemotaxis protein
VQEQLPSRYLPLTKGQPLARKILLADDSVTAQNMGRRILTDAGYEVVTVNNGSAALKKIAEQKPDLIVLDVYMPGYGGLEVCQRLKENRETARIPILLTVGKLEPFKPDEARRVRADAFIVKPFEASELLTALTKLEDKIVPQPEPYKQGRFAKAIAAVEHITEKGEGFGDAETGWKDRLKFPGAKAPETEPETAAAASTKHPELARGADFKPAEAAKDFERPIPAGLPADITPDEIAAITAAAAAFSGKAEPSVTHPEAVAAEAHAPVAQAEAEKSSEPAEAVKSEAATTESTTPEAPAATFAAAPEADAAPGAESSPAVPEVPQAVAASAEQTSPAEMEPAKKPAEEPSEAKFASEVAPGHKPSDADVLAALASIMPSLPSDGQGQDGEAPHGRKSDHQEEPEVAAVAAAVGAALSGPRWIAEPVALDSSEAAMILEQEMEKALAAMAAAEAAASVPGPAEAAPASFASTLAEASTASSEAATSAPAQVEPAATSTAGPETISESKAEITAAGATVEAVSETPATNESEPAAVVSAVAGAEPAVPVAEATQPPVASGDGAISEPKEEAAFAAAAGASPGMGEPARASEPASQAIGTPASTEAAPGQGESQSACQVDAASAAAWENWRHIRDTVVGTELTSQIADAAAAQLKDIQEQSAPVPSETAKPESAESTPPATASSDSNSIASIVDSVLAELKPKLVEEIARKMGGEKEKEKKKKKRD